MGTLALLAYLLGLGLLLARALRRRARAQPAPAPPGRARPGSWARLGPADWVTLTRALLVGVVTGLIVSSPVASPLSLSLTTVALLLDFVDGQVARRTGTASEFGARFDMEVDAFLILVLSGQVAWRLGAWVLAIGAMRYVYVAVGWIVPWLRGRVPPRYWGKVVAAIQGITLTAATILPPVVAVPAVAAALALLIESFGRDVVWLWLAHRRARHQDRRPVTRVETSNSAPP